MDESVDDTNGPLSGLRVVELGQLLAGPFCGQILADFGADVIKLEEPTSGDPMREWGREKPHGLSLWWPILSRNKKSVTCNLRREEGQLLARRLMANADIVIENFRPGTVERWGLGYDDLKAINPGIIMTRVTGYGQSGPYAPQAGYGSIGEAMGGLRYTTGDPDRPPSRTGISIGDALAGVFSAVGTLVALQERTRTGRGQVVDGAIYEAVLAVMESLIPEYEIGGYIRERTGSILPNVAPSNVYPTRDGDMILLAANQDTVFRRLCELMGTPELAEDERFVTHGARGEHQDQLDEIVAAWTSKHGATEVLDALNSAGVAAGRVYTAKEMLEDPHFAARNAIVRVASKDFGEIPMPNVVPKLSETPGRIQWVGPTLGQHDEVVYGDRLGITEEELDDLRREGIVRPKSVDN